MMVKPASSSIATPSPALAALPLTSTDPRTTWTQLLRPGLQLMLDRVGAAEERVVDLHVLVDEYRAVAAIGRADQPQPSGFFGFSKCFLIISGWNPLAVRQYPYLQEVHRLGFRVVELAVPDPGAGRHHLDVARA